MNPSKPKSVVGEIHLDEGYLTPEEIDLILEYLPFDIGFVDGSQNLTYTNHGAANLAQLDDDQLASFERGEVSSTETLVASEDGDILLQAADSVLDDKGGYEGILLVGQNVSPIRALTGERRILDWD